MVYLNLPSYSVGGGGQKHRFVDVAYNLGWSGVEDTMWHSSVIFFGGTVADFMPFIPNWGP